MTAGFDGREVTHPRDRGAAILEFALIVPLLVMLVVAVFEFGRFMNIQISLQGASREGARTLALGQPSSAVSKAVTDSAPGTRITRIVQTACPAAGGTATVRAESDFTFGIPLVPIGRVTVRASSSMRCGL
jgi:Flp pilus assembly protein TadG